MSYVWRVECFFEDQNMRLGVYTGESMFAAWKAYRKAKTQGGKYFLIEYRP